jgi:hypothetical protein
VQAANDKKEHERDDDHDRDRDDRSGERECRDVRLEVHKHGPNGWADAEQGITPSFSFLIPNEVSGHLHRAQGVSVIFSYTLAATCEIKHCTYLPRPKDRERESRHEEPGDDEDAQATLRLTGCDGGAKAGDHAFATDFAIHVEGGLDLREGSVELTLHEAAPCPVRLEGSIGNRNVSSCPPARCNLSPAPADGLNIPMPVYPVFPLNTGTVDAFIAWTQQIPKIEYPDLKNQIDIARRSTEAGTIHDMLVDRLQVLSDSAGVKFTILSLIGELADPRAVDVLRTFINRPIPASTTSASTSQPNQPKPHTGPGFAGLVEMLEARAAIALGAVGSTAALQTLLDVAGQHPSTLVRSTAADAYLFKMGDSAEAKKTLGARLSADDQRFLYRARATADGDPGQFDAQVRAFYKRFPEDLPPPAQFSPSRIPPKTVPKTCPSAPACPPGETCSR